MIYLDHNATTPLDEEVREAVIASLGNFGNPSSGHAIGLKARGIVELSRARTASLLGCRSKEIFFTSGGTESNNLAILGTARLYGKGHILTSCIEHPSVLNPVAYLESAGFEVSRIGVDGQCGVSPDEIKESVREDTILISIMHSNNETGTIQPVEEIYAFCRERGITFHTDAAQSAGKIPIGLCADMITLVSHKFYGPKGVGALYVKEGVELSPIMFGAGHEGGLRPGTENVAGIAGIGKACETAKRDMQIRVSKTESLTRFLWDELKKKFDDIRQNGSLEFRLPNTLNVCIPGVDAHSTVDALKDSVAVSTGSACHSGEKKPSPVLKAMGLSDEDAHSSFRFSTGKDNTEEEIKEAVRIFSEIFRQPGRRR